MLTGISIARGSIIRTSVSKDSFQRAFRNRGLRTRTALSPHPTRLGRYARRAGYLLAGITGIYIVDRVWNASAITRNARTLWTCAMITFDYKVNFTEANNDHIPELHERVANRMYDLFTSNGGAYIKVGQALAANAAFLPKPVQEKFSKLFDDAPQVPYSEILQVFQSELGRPPDGPDGIFEVFEKDAVASASIAQVHKAKLRPIPGDPDTQEKWVAVKVQKPAVAKQMKWDLGAYRLVMWMFENWAFDLPVYFVVDFVSDHIRHELDFLLEAENAKQTTRFVASEPRLSQNVYIPKVYDQFTTKRVMTAEWIDGVRLSDRAGIRRLIGAEKDITVTKAIVPASVDSPAVHDAPPTSFTYPPAPLKGGVNFIMKTMVELFSAQMFSWGWVHCDPHPGNVIIRPNPHHPTRPQLVLLDHGLYVRVNDEFRKDWSALWKGLLTADYSIVERTTTKWGVGLPDMFASVTLAKPVKLSRKNRDLATEQEKLKKELTEYMNMSQYQQSVVMKKKLKVFLTDTDRMPKELIFLLRNMRIVQGNNQSFGSPVNRIKITGYWASRSLTRASNLTFTERIREYTNHIAFRGVMLSLDIAFWTTRLKQWFWAKFGRVALSFEDELEKTMRGLMKGNLGMDVETGVFNG
ncbi:ABC1-domain-containing protein [Marasmius fiardii PR-910]|nr:ABC1-domain-containing protein [Marasmius fiardii PR-910]